MTEQNLLRDALKLILQKNWLHKEGLLERTRQLLPGCEAELQFILTRAQHQRMQEEAHQVEPLGATVASVLVEILRQYVAQEQRFWTEDERDRLQVGLLLILRQYLTANDRNMPRKKVLKYLQDENYLRETWQLTQEEASHIRATVENISPKLYSLRLTEGIDLLARAVQRIVSLEGTKHEAPESGNEYAADVVSQMSTGDDGENLALPPTRVPPVEPRKQDLPVLATMEQEQHASEPSLSDGDLEYRPQPIDYCLYETPEVEPHPVEAKMEFWLKLLPKAQQVMIFDEAFAADDALDLTLEEVREQLVLMEQRDRIKRVVTKEKRAGSVPTDERTRWYQLTETSWSILGPRQPDFQPSSLQIDQRKQRWPLPISVAVGQSANLVSQSVTRYLLGSLPKPSRGWYSDVVIGLWLISLALALWVNENELYFPIVILVPAVWETYRQALKAT